MHYYNILYYYNNETFSEYIDLEIAIRNSDPFIFTFYMVSLMEKSLKNPKLNEQHSKNQANSRRDFSNVLSQLLSKRTTEPEPQEQSSPDR